jgi:hypothetical protein
MSLALIAEPPKAHKNGEELAVRWLICEWPSKETESTKYWLSNSPPDARRKSTRPGAVQRNCL